MHYSCCLVSALGSLCSRETVGILIACFSSEAAKHAWCSFCTSQAHEVYLEIHLSYLYVAEIWYPF